MSIPDSPLRSTITRAETDAHRRLKRSALIWAQAQGYRACAAEVHLPRCRFRADVAAYRSAPNAVTAIFECKQALSDLRRDNCCVAETRARLASIQRRRLVLEKYLRVHYPALRIPDSLFPEFDSHDFGRIQHHGYARVVRELNALQNRLCDCAKFETLRRYAYANLYFLVLPERLFRESEVPTGWGALIERDNELSLVRKSTWRETTPEAQLHFLERIARVGTRRLNQQLEITFGLVQATRCRSC